MSILPKIDREGLGLTPLEELASLRRPLSMDDMVSADAAVARFGRGTFLLMIEAAPPERARRLANILQLAERYRRD